MFSEEEIRFLLGLLAQEVVVEPSLEFPFTITKESPFGYSKSNMVGRLQAALSIMLEAAARTKALTVYPRFATRIDMKNVTFLGTSDEVNTCDCCGRKDLKSTVALETEEGQTVFFGVVCAAKALKRTAKEVKSEAKKAQDAKEAAERAARDAARRVEDARWQAFLDSKVDIKDWSGHGDRLAQIDALGGFKAAREMFRAEAAK